MLEEIIDQYGKRLGLPGWPCSPDHVAQLALDDERSLTVERIGSDVLVYASAPLAEAATEHLETLLGENWLNETALQPTTATGIVQGDSGPLLVIAMRHAIRDFDETILHDSSQALLARLANL
ncbi:hypothetical protein QS306_09300 [Paraburkholderia bonniea]|uniref:hypothetical protein n=1 Tax=Paraburkholderia bonniea TaxID=2152891 RepID=UPI001290BF36|nr:hypothetical protein [Paraburkholderia bonniea]WJF89318.1 hypothetical protein QS306_09300 [Paraburkholderia bonniea]WJF92634.1 hypothetical protein QS308_09310 [Paraburkholderia bonniea]